MGEILLLWSVSREQRALHLPKKASEGAQLLTPVRPLGVRGCRTHRPPQRICLFRMLQPRSLLAGPRNEREAGTQEGLGHGAEPLVGLEGDAQVGTMGLEPAGSSGIQQDRQGELGGNYMPPSGSGPQ